MKESICEVGNTPVEDSEGETNKGWEGRKG